MGLRQLRPLAGMAVALTAVHLAGCADNTPATTATSPGQSAAATSVAGMSAAPAPSQAPRTENWTKLQAGDCLADAPPADPAVVMVTLVDCAQPHLAETFLRAPIPVDAALDGTASTQCEAGFVEYTGGPSAGSPYTITYLIDSDQDRTYNNPLPSTVICLLQDAQGQSLNGSARK
jgi:hypothetical protein